MAREAASADLRSVAHALYTELLELRVIKRRKRFTVDPFLSIPHALSGQARAPFCARFPKYTSPYIRAEKDNKHKTKEQQGSWADVRFAYLAKCGYDTFESDFRQPARNQ